MMIPVDQVLKATHRKFACCVTIVSQITPIWYDFM
jgi:hypothetical protein